MTNKDAIIQLGFIRRILTGKDREALTLAIEALEERPTDELNRVKNELNNELKGHYLTNCQNCQSDYSRGYNDGFKEGKRTNDANL